MNLQYTTTAAALLLFSLATLSASQTTDPPPIKLGLWLEEVTTTITGIDGVTPTARKDVERYCIRPDTWRHGLQAANPQDADHSTVSNLHQDIHQITYEKSCSSQQHNPVVLHMEILIDNDRQMHGSAKRTIPAIGSALEGKWSSTLTERYLGPDCGDIKPGEQKPVKQ